MLTNLFTKRPRKYVISDINMLVYKIVMAGTIVLFCMTDHMFRVPFVFKFVQIFVHKFGHKFVDKYVKGRPLSDSEAAKMYKLRGQSLNK